MCGRFALGQQHIDFLEALDAQYPRIFRRQPGGRAPQRLRGGGPQDEEDTKPDVKTEDAETKPSTDDVQPKEEKPQAEHLESSNQAGDESNAPNDQKEAEADDEVKPKTEDDTKPDTKKDSEELKWHAAPSLGFKWKREQDFWPR